jgi:hypothetical protein
MISTPGHRVLRRQPTQDPASLVAIDVFSSRCAQPRAREGGAHRLEGAHTQGMTIAQGARTFENRCLQEASVAKTEAMRVVDDPTDLYYTIDNLEIYKLRADYRKKRSFLLFTGVSRRLPQ